MTAQRVERRLTAIFVGDVAGYSSLMGAEEEGTLSRLNTHRRESWNPRLPSIAPMIAAAVIMMTRQLCRLAGFMGSVHWGCSLTQSQCLTV
jgi:hypothetical protein